MTLQEVHQLVDEIQQLLISSSEPAEEELIDLSSRHEEFVKVVADRLRSVDALLSQGLRSEAIELAEREPNLNDVVTALDFPEFDTWNQRLAEAGIQAVPALPEDLAADLNDAYSVSTPVERLLQRHRSAALARAPLPVRIEILRRLAAVDAENPVWKKDLKSYEKQRITEVGSELDHAVRNSDLDTLAALDRELKSSEWTLAVPGELTRKVVEAHTRLRESAARIELNTLSYHLSDAFAAFDLDQARSLYQRFQALRQIVSLPVSDPLMDVAGPALDWVRDENEKEHKDARFQEILGLIEKALNDNAASTELEQLYYDALKYDRQLPDLLTSRLADRLETLRVEAVRRRRTMLASAMAGVTLLLILTGLFIWQIRTRTIIDRHVSQLQQLLREAETNGHTAPLAEYFQLMQNEPDSISQAAEILGLKQQMEALRTAESTRNAQIDQLIENANVAADRASMPRDLEESMKTLEEASRLAKNTSEKMRISVGETKVRDKRATLQTKLDENFGSRVKQITETIAALPNDALSPYDEVVRQLDEAAKMPEVSPDLIASIVTLRSKVLRERGDIKLRIDTLKGLQSITDAVGKPDEFATRLKSFADTFPETKKSADFQFILNSEQHLWKGVTEWNSLRTELLSVNISEITQQAAKTMLDRFATFQKTSGPYPGEMNLGKRLLALQAVAKRKTGSRGSLFEIYRSAFDGKAITSSFLILLPDGKTRFYADAPPLIEKKRLLFDYYTTPAGDQMISKEMNLSVFPSAEGRKRDDWISPQSRLTQSVLRDQEKTGGSDFESEIARVVARVLREESEMDPVLRLLLAERLMTEGANGSVYIADRSERLLNEISELGIPRLTNWVDQESVQTKKLRATAASFLEKSRDSIIESLEGARTDRNAAKSQKIGPSLMWAGWIFRPPGSGTSWEIRTRSGTALKSGSVLCVMGRAAPDAKPQMTIVGNVAGSEVVLLQENIEAASPREGRPVFQVLDDE